MLSHDVTAWWSWRLCLAALCLLGLLLARSAFGLEPRPLPAYVAGLRDCPILDLVPGQPLPKGLLDAEGRVVCTGHTIGTGRLAYALEVESHAVYLDGIYRSDTGWLEARCAEPPRPRWHETRAAGIVIGATSAVAVILATAWVLGEIR